MLNRDVQYTFNAIILLSTDLSSTVDNKRKVLNVLMGLRDAGMLVIISVVGVQPVNQNVRK